VPEEPEAVPYEIAPGEITIGRAPSNNLVVDEGAVSKVHARIERTRDQLVLEDLGSANGTFVNGARLTAAFLKDGDAVSLGNVETFRIVIEMGEVTSASGRHTAFAAGGSATGRLRFSAEWKTRLDWSSGEREEPALGAAAPPVKPAGPIATVRLTGSRTNLSVTQPGAYTIGRSREVELRVDHPSVSRKHARLILGDDRVMVYLQDHGGANGTRHNGKEVEKLAPLADGDTIGLGEVDLKVELDRG
jgi:ABC transport system ATP-binding/permease protein